MANLKVQYTCGCGFRTTDPIKAMAHVNENQHTLTVVGTVEPGIPKPVNNPKKAQHGEPAPSTPSISIGGFDELRQRLADMRR